MSESRKIGHSPTLHSAHASTAPARRPTGDRSRSVLRGIPLRGNPGYRGNRHTATQHLRLVGIKNPLTGTDHLYLTTIAPDQLSARAIAQTYTARWLIELLFKQLRSFYQLESFPSQNVHLVQALIYAALITMLVSRRIEQALRQLIAAKQATDATREEAVFPLLRLAAVLTSLSSQLLQAVLQQAGLRSTPLSLTELLLKEAKDPNHQRDTLTQILQKI